MSRVVRSAGLKAPQGKQRRPQGNEWDGCSGQWGTVLRGRCAADEESNVLAEQFPVSSLLHRGGH